MKTATTTLMQTMPASAGFTLLEIMIAATIASVLMIAVYGVFASSIKMRDNATERNRATVLRTRAIETIRNDLRNGLVSGGILAATLQGDSNGTDGDASFPGYLRLTTTGGKDFSSGTTSELYGDVQLVEYYIVRGTNSTGPADGGNLVRIVTRDLLNSTGNNLSVTHQQQLLTGVQSLQVSFYDGSTWQPSWQISGSTSGSSTPSTTSGTSSTSSSTSGSATSGTASMQVLPQAIRVDIQQVTPPGAAQPPPPVEIYEQWTTAPFLSGTNYSIGSGSGVSQ